MELGSSHLIRHGAVTTVSKGNWTATVLFEDYDNETSGDLFVIQREPVIETTITNYPDHLVKHKIESWFPEIGDRVLCVLFAKGKGDGCILGRIS